MGIFEEIRELIEKRQNYYEKIDILDKIDDVLVCRINTSMPSVSYSGFSRLDSSILEVPFEPASNSLFLNIHGMMTLSANISYICQKPQRIIFEPMESDSEDSKEIDKICRKYSLFFSPEEGVIYVFKSINEVLENFNTEIEGIETVSPNDFEVERMFFENCMSRCYDDLIEDARHLYGENFPVLSKAIHSEARDISVLTGITSMAMPAIVKNLKATKKYMDENKIYYPTGASNDLALDELEEKLQTMQVTYDFE